MPFIAGAHLAGKDKAGDTEKNIRDAIKGCLASLKKHGEPIPPAIDEELAEVNA